MATFERHVDVDWQGTVMEGKGEAKAGTGAFSLPVTFASRIGEPAGRTSPALTPARSRRDSSSVVSVIPGGGEAVSGARQ